MNDEGITLDSVDPQWMQDGLGVIGDQPDYPEEFVRDWDTNAWTDDSQQTEDFVGAGSNDCMTAAGAPPNTGTVVLGSIDGVCQWIDTTTCP